MYDKSVFINIEVGRGVWDNLLASGDWNEDFHHKSFFKKLNSNAQRPPFTLHPHVV